MSRESTYLGAQRANIAVRVLIWFVAFAGWIYYKKPAGAALSQMRGGLAGGIGLTLLVCGLGLFLWSTVTLARAFHTPSGVTAQMVMRGPYRYVRNPMYLGGAFVFVGIYLLYAEWQVTDVVAALLVAGLLHLAVVRREEPATRRRLGQAYEDYCRRVPRWLPRLADPPYAQAPEGASTVIPRLVCRDPAAAIDFCVNTFGAIERLRRLGPDGKVAHAMLTIGSAMIMIEGEWPTLTSRAPRSDGSSPVVIYVYVADVDQTMERATANGAQVLVPLQNQFWGDRIAWIMDPSGHVWTVATRIEETTSQERADRWSAIVADRDAT